METVYFEKPSELKKNREAIEQRLGIRLNIQGKKVSFEGDSVQEFEALNVLGAMAFGFSTKIALLLINEDFLFRKIHIKANTRRKNLEDVRGRLIGAEGKTRRTLEQISGCYIIVGASEVGVVGPAEVMDTITTALLNLIKGSKQANVYHYLEQSNVQRKQLKDDLGLKISKGKDSEEEGKDEDSEED